MKKNILKLSTFIFFMGTSALQAQNAQHLLKKIDQFFLNLGDRITMHRQVNDKIVRGTDWLAQYDNPNYVAKKPIEKKDTAELTAVKIYGDANDKELLAHIDQVMRTLEGVHIFSPARQEPGRQPHIPYTIASYWTTDNDTAHIFYSAFQNGETHKKMEKK
jgi:hypothetical protein